MSLGRVFNMSAKSALLSYCVWSLSKAQSGMTVSAAQSRSIRRLIAYSLLRRELLRRSLKRREQRRLLRAASTPHQHRHREAHDDLHQDRLLRAASTPHQHRHREAHDDLHQDLHDRHNAHDLHNLHDLHNAHDLHNLHEDLDDEEVQPPRGVDKQQQTLESDTWSDSGDDRDMLRLLLTEKEPDSFGYFGLFVAARLREVDPHYRGPAMVKIMQLLNSYTVDEDEFQGASPSPVQRDCTYTGTDGDKVQGASPSPVQRDSPQRDSNKGFCFVASIPRNSFDDESNASHDSLEELFDEAIPDDELDTTHNASHDDLHDTSPNDLDAPQDDLQHASQNVQADAVPDVPKAAPQDRLQDTLHESSQDDSQCASLGDYLDSFHDAAQDARDL